MRERTGHVASVLAFPVILGGTLALALGLLPRLGAELTLSIATGAGLLAVVVAEQLWPYRAAWGRAQGDLGTDVLHALVSGVASSWTTEDRAAVERARFSRASEHA